MATGLVAWKKVTERSERTAKAGIVRVTMEDAFGKRETLNVTHNHPYLRAANDNGPGILNAVKLDPGGDWSAAGLLKPGDKVLSARAPISRAPYSEGVNRQRNQNGAHLEVVSVEPVEGLAAKVYNLEVADHHTYAVGELQAWAHNALGGGNPFGGKTPGEIAGMLDAKGFIRRGPDPVCGLGGWVNPRTGRSFHIDACHCLPIGPHVDVNYRRGRGPGGSPKKRYPM